jgi:hypothetical protein
VGKEPPRTVLTPTNRQNDRRSRAVSLRPLVSQVCYYHDLFETSSTLIKQAFALIPASLTPRCSSSIAKPGALCYLSY